MSETIGYKSHKTEIYIYYVCMYIIMCICTYICTYKDTALIIHAVKVGEVVSDRGVG